MLATNQGSHTGAPERTGADGALIRKARALELAVFLFLILPSMVLALFAFRAGTVGFDLIALATILRDLALVCLIAYFLWRNREPLSNVGWTLHEAVREIALGVALFIPLSIATGVLDALLREAGLSGTPKVLRGMLTPASHWQFVLAFVLVAVVAFAEETIFRGYLILRLQELTGSPFWAAFLSSVVFSVGHGYEGAAGVITVGAMGFGLALVYLWRRSLMAPIAMHFLQDLMAIIVLPLLAHAPKG